MKSHARVYIAFAIAILFLIVFPPFVFNAVKPYSSFSFRSVSYFLPYFRAWLNLPGLTEENNELREQLYSLMNEKTQTVKLNEEINDLRLILDFKKKNNFNLSVASVISRTPQALGLYLAIDKGSDDGLKQGLPVVSSQGVLVGKIKKVEKNRSFVLLVTDPLSKVSGVSSVNRVEGVVSGGGGGSMSYDFVTADSSLNKDELILTSGLEENVPAGILIGQVREVETDKQELLLKVQISPAFDRLRLSILSVIVQ